MNSSGKLNGDPKWFTPPFTWSGLRMSQMSFLFLSSIANTGSSAYTWLPSPKMPGPEANTEYHWPAFLTSVDLPKSCVTICASASATALLSPSGPPSRPLQFAFMPRYSGSS